MENRKYTIEDVESLKGKTGISYEEAIGLLEKYEGDVARCLIELEKRGKLDNKDATFDLGGTLTELWRKGCAIRIVIKHEETLLVNLPLVYVALALILGWQLLLASALLALILGCRLNLVSPGSDDPAPEQKPAEEPEKPDEKENKDGYSGVTIE